MKNAVLKIASVAAVLARFLFIAFWKHQKQRRKLIEGTGITFWRYLRQRDFRTTIDNERQSNLRRANVTFTCERRENAGQTEATGLPH